MPSFFPEVLIMENGKIINNPGRFDDLKNNPLYVKVLDGKHRDSVGVLENKFDDLYKKREFAAKEIFDFTYPTLKINFKDKNITGSTHYYENRIRGSKIELTWDKPGDLCYLTHPDLIPNVFDSLGTHIKINDFVVYCRNGLNLGNITNITKNKIVWIKDLDSGELIKGKIRPENTMVIDENTITTILLRKLSC